MHKRIKVSIDGIMKDELSKTHGVIAVLYTNDVFKDINISKHIGSRSLTLNTTPIVNKSDTAYIDIVAEYEDNIDGVSVAGSIRDFEKAIFEVIAEIKKDPNEFKFTYEDCEYNPAVISQKEFAESYNKGII